MAKGDITEKRQILVDGEEWEGLVNVEAYELAQGTVEVPGRDKIIPVKNGVLKIPEINLKYKTRRDSQTYQRFINWRDNNEFHDVTHIILDQTGREIARELWPNTECSKVDREGYDAANPVFAQINVRMLPEDVIPIAAEG
jgi:hypothetical protein